MPLIASPIMAVGLTAVFYPILTRLRKKTSITIKSELVTVQPVPDATLVAAKNNRRNITTTTSLKIDEVPIDTMGSTIQQPYMVKYKGEILGMHFQMLVDKLHYISGGAVCFARSLNDTPKFLGLLLLCQFFGLKMNIFLLALVMIIGGLLHSGKVANTMSKKITRLNAGQGLTANLSTSFLVIVASRFGLPVSTTHVSVGSIFGIGLVNGTADKKQMKSIVASWILTLPVAAFFSALIFLLFKLNLR